MSDTTYDEQLRDLSEQVDLLLGDIEGLNKDILAVEILVKDIRDDLDKMSANLAG
jgi:hypothetical protein